MANMSKLEAILSDKQNIAALGQCKNGEEALAFLNEKGAEMTVDDMKQLADILRRTADDDEDLSPDELAAVSGGAGLNLDLSRALVNVKSFIIDTFNEAFHWLFDWMGD